jgi:endonuclease YncB( thermonuclease family)
LKYILIGLLLFTFAVSATDYRWKINRVIDGDTIAVTITELPLNVMPSMVRIGGIDTPELDGRAKCEKERLLGQAAAKFTSDFLKNAMYENKNISFTNIKRDKYSSRVVGDVKVDGQDLGKLLLEKGFAKPYDGKSKKPDWCS